MTAKDTIMGQGALKQYLTPPAELRHDLRENNSPGMLLRRALIGASVIGIGCMTVTALFQSGIIRRIPDPPIQGFDSDKVNSSDTAYGWGMPDSPLSIINHAVNFALATVGGANRAETQPLVPIVASAATLPAAVTSARYLFYQMPVVEKGWCPYCITDALMHIASFGFTVWETSKALRRFWRR